LLPVSHLCDCIIIDNAENSERRPLGSLLDYLMQIGVKMKIQSNTITITLQFNNTIYYLKKFK